jgi:hypothetical protein
MMNEIIFIRTERGKQQAFDFILEVIRRGNLSKEDANYLDPLIGLLF